MKRLLLVAAVLAGAIALAGQAARDSSGAPPADLGPSNKAAKDGVTLANAVGCRMSVRVDGGTGLLGDGGTDVIGSDGLASSGWKLIPWYYDPSLGWVESKSSLHCSPEARPDGGRIKAFVCPDIQPLASFGRISVSKFGPVGYDGGTGADLIADSGSGPQPIYRIECWGPQLVGP